MSRTVTTSYPLQVTVNCKDGALITEYYTHPTLADAKAAAQQTLLNEALREQWYGATPFQILSWDFEKVKVLSAPTGESTYKFKLTEDCRYILTACDD